MNRYLAQFHSAHVDIDVPEDLNTEELRAWLIRKIEEIDVQRKKFQEILQRYSNTRTGKKQYTPEQLATVRAERTILQEQRGAYRALLGDLNAANKEINRILNSRSSSQQFSEHFVAVARDMLSAEEFNRIFNETHNRMQP